MSTVTGTARVVDKSGHVATATATCEVQDFDVVIAQGDPSPAAKFNAAPAGAKILITGFHRLTTHLVPKSDQDITLNGTLDCSRMLTGWVADGGDWTVSGALPVAYNDSQASPEFTTGDTAYACKWRENVFIDGTLIKRVTNRAAVGPGTYYGDYTANKIYLGDDPTGKLVELGRTNWGIKSNAARVTLRGTGWVQRAATPAQQGAIQIEGPDWTIEAGLGARWNHAIGIRTTYGHRAVIRSFKSYDNGQMGYGCHRSQSVQWLSCRFYRNNTDGFNPYDWEAGAGKTAYSTDTYFWDCWAYDNHGIGFWNDIDNDGTKIMWCRSERNSSCGIRDEIGYNSEIGYNQIHNNGLKHWPGSGSPYASGRDAGFYATAGINCNSSGGRNGGRVWIHHNNLTGNRDGVSVNQRDRKLDGVTNPLWVLKAVLVENNTIASAVLLQADGTRWVDQNGWPISSWSGPGALEQTSARSKEIWDTDVVFRNNQYASTEMIMRWTGTRWGVGSLAQAQADGKHEVGSTLLAA
jgi:hypothetical protein